MFVHAPPFFVRASGLSHNAADEHLLPDGARALQFGQTLGRLHVGRRRSVIDEAQWRFRIAPSAQMAQSESEIGQGAGKASGVLSIVEKSSAC